MPSTLPFLSANPTKIQVFSPKTSPISPAIANQFLLFRTHFHLSPPWTSKITKKHGRRLPCSGIPFVSTDTTHYEFHDDSSEVELRLELGRTNTSPGEVSVDARDGSLVIKVQYSGYQKTLLDTNSLYGTIKPSETIWYIDDDQLVVNLKKQDPELKWPDIMESWESLTTGVAQLLKGTSIFLVGESTDINHKIARELAVGLGYTPLCTKELLEAYAQRTIDSWITDEGSEAVTEAEVAVIESLSSQARTVVATLGGNHGSAKKPDKWRHLFAGFTVWLSQSEAIDPGKTGLDTYLLGRTSLGLLPSHLLITLARRVLSDIGFPIVNTDEDSAREEAKKNISDGCDGYTNAEAVVKLGGWDPTYSKAVAQASLSALKRLILSDGHLPGCKSLYVRLGCRGDWPDIKPPGWDPATGTEAFTSSL